jgi:hypothetical protein
VDAGLDIVRSGAGEFFLWIGGEAALVALAGLALLVVSVLIREKQPDTAPPYVSGNMTA